MRIQHNIAAMNSYSKYANNVSAVNKNLEKLSSGYKINRAGDDAAGLAISEKMRAQITGLDAAQKNVKDGISLVKTAEGAMQEIQDMLNRMDYLATQSANGTYDNEVDRMNLNKEVTALKTEIDRIADSANFNGIKLLDGSLSGGGKVTSSGTVFTGANVSKFSAGEMATGITVSGGDDLTDDKISTDAYSTEIYILDGQKLEIDMSKGNGATIASLLYKDFSGGLSEEGIKKLASDLTDAFNAEIAEQGLQGSVKFSVSSDGVSIIAQSTNQGADSEFGFAGVTVDGGKSGGDAAAVSSIGAYLFADTAGTGVSGATSIKAQQDYNGAQVVTNEVFNMEINGVKVAVTIGALISPQLGDPSNGGTAATTMNAASTTLQTAIRAAVAKYNEDMGLTAGSLDKVSGLTGLTTTDFTVEADKSGGFKITYTGDESVSFSFNDVGDRDVAQRLGLANGSSSRGGAGGLNLQIGDTADSYNQMNVSIGDMHVLALGIKNVDISTQDGAAKAIEAIKAAINSVSSVRGDLGAIQNRLDHTYNNLSTMQENIQDAESTIRDTDVAEEMMSYTKNNILVQSAQAMLAQANQIPQGVLQLLG